MNLRFGTPALLTPAEVGAMLKVDPKTVTRWARTGKLRSIKTPGGHRRYSETEVLSFLEGIGGEGTNGATS